MRRRKNPPLARWVNAAEILPEELLMEVQKYIDGDILYIPKVSPKKEWGLASGSKRYYVERNSEIRELYHQGVSIEQLGKQFGLANSTIKRILYR